jgi:hypothetical protein
MHNQDMAIVRRMSIIISISTILLSITIISTRQLVYAQFDASYCQGKKDEMISRAGDWNKQWGTATSDPNSQIRTDGKQLASEIGLTLNNCESNLDDHDKLVLTKWMDVINAEIDRNIDFGPPCDPTCKSGPPIS